MVFTVRIFPPAKILAARPEDSGTYVCTARSGDGSSETKVEVIVEGKPRVSVPEPQVVVVEGGTATLRCIAHGNNHALPFPTAQTLLLTLNVVSSFSSPCDHLVQATLPVAVET